MNPVLSVYFDLLRPLAALVVVLHHLWPLCFPAMPLPWPGHHAVVLFFVLSGCVIRHASIREDGGTYALHRTARILSVALPALLLSVLLLAWLGPPHLSGGTEAHVSWAQTLWRLLANAVFLGQSWGLNLLVPFNGPYWSLCYEVWYYVIFGVAFYLRTRLRWLWLLLALAAAGPGILALMPIWLMGVVLYDRTPRWRSAVAWPVFIVSAVVAAALFWVDAGVVIRSWMGGRWPAAMHALGASNQFVGDTLMGVAVSLHFAAAANLPAIGRLLQPVQGAVRGLSGYTFSIYLFHMPLAVLLWYGLGLQSWLLFWPALAVGLWALAQLSERRLPAWRRALAAGVIWINGRAGARMARS